MHEHMYYTMLSPDFQGRIKTMFEYINFDTGEIRSQTELEKEFGEIPTLLWLPIRMRIETSIFARYGRVEIEIKKGETPKQALVRQKPKRSRPAKKTSRRTSSTRQPSASDVLAAQVAQGIIECLSLSAKMSSSTTESNLEAGDDNE